MTIKRTYRQHVTITGPNEEQKAALEYCARGGFTIHQSGPKRLPEYRISLTRFRIKASRIIKKKP